MNIDTKLDIKGMLSESLDNIEKYINKTFKDGDSQHKTVKAADSWNPFIDKAICNDCGQCYEFCIFKVYTKDDNGKVVISNPHACKDYCPACARLCPKNAIVFPKHPDPILNGSAEVAKDDSEPIDTEALFKGDIYKAFAARRGNSDIFRKP
jgi:NAD-dependent dihydropyrimidine dehydrogenase PreA subunit